MTSKDHAKVLKQIAHKKVKAAKFTKHNKPKSRTTGKGKNKCVNCGRKGGHIRKYGLHLCRQCFRDLASELGFRKYG